MKKINKVSREPPTTIQDAIKRYILQLYTLQREPNHTGEIIPFNMDEWYNTILKRPMLHYQEASSTTYHKQDKTRTRQIKRYTLQLYTLQ